jgi:inner membrane protein
LDSVSQIALGAAACHVITGKQLGRKALILGALLGTLPDLDVLINYGDVVSNYTKHRGFSHSLIVLTLLTPFVSFLLRLFKSFRSISNSKLLLAIWLALVTHPILDSFTVYGTQLFWPLMRPPESWASIFIIDPLYTIPLVITGLWALFKKPNFAGLSLIGLIVSSSYLGWSMYAKTQVIKHIRSELYRQGISYTNFKVTPERFNTLNWRGIVMDQQVYYETRVSVLRPNTAVTFTAYNHNKQWINNLKNNHAAQRLAWFTSGFYKISDRQNIVVISDLRMGSEGFSIFEFAVADRSNLNKPFWPRNAIK